MNSPQAAGCIVPLALMADGRLCKPEPDLLDQRDARTLSPLMSDIADPALRRRLLALCTVDIGADPHLADTESLLLLAAVEHWDLTQGVLQAPVPRLDGLNPAHPEHFNRTLPWTP
jgi:hypothetical protein